MNLMVCTILCMYVMYAKYFITSEVGILKYAENLRNKANKVCRAKHRAAKFKLTFLSSWVLQGCPPFWFYGESIWTSVHGSHIVVVKAPS